MEETFAPESECFESPSLQFFSESHWEELLKLIEEISQCGSKEIFEDIARLERNFESFAKILDLYQEQPHLLDPKLSEFVEILLKEMRKYEAERSRLPREQIFKFLCHLIKVRSYKVVSRNLPHDVGQLQFVLDLLESENLQKRPDWETRYVLLIWLAIICKNPFDMSRFDVSTADVPIRERIMTAGKSCLAVADRSKEAAAVLLAEFLIRPDMKTFYLQSELTSAVETLQTLETSSNEQTARAWGLLLLISQVFKKGSREDLLVHCDSVLKGLCHCQLESSHNSLLRKMLAKSIQRIAMVMLKPKIATWRYQRGSRSLLATNISGQTPTTSESKTAENQMETEDFDDDYDIPEQIEQILTGLLGSLKDRDTVVRWSAAKGIGRIVARLPKELADEVLGSILSLLSDFESDSSWHGGFLALAELGRRGLLLPSRLADVTPLIVAGLNYEEQRGRFSVGTNVRDAACYVCWALARAYQPQEFAPYVNLIAASLITTSLFDREVNCRRAASAAFQENVGRQGTFPNGIDIVTLVDYFSVGPLAQGYLELSTKIAKFPQYTRPIIDHLTALKIGHGDVKIRKLAATTLGLLVKVDLNCLRSTVLPKLIANAASDQLFLRQGAILAIGEVTKAICEAAKEDLSCALDSSCEVEISSLPTRIYQANQLRGIGGELMRDAINWLIDRLGRSFPQFPRPKEMKTVQLWMKLLEENLCHRELSIRLGAAEALQSVGVYFTVDAESNDFAQLRNQLVVTFTKGIVDAPTEVVRMGMALALSSLPTPVVVKNVVEISSVLLLTATVTSPRDKFWAEGRSDVISAMAVVTSKVLKSPPAEWSCAQAEDFLSAAFNCCLTALNDYTIDARGDIGTKVRESGLKALKKLADLMVDSNSAVVATKFFSTDDRFFSLCLKVLHQMCEKLDRTRVIAAEVLRFLLVTPQLQQFPVAHRNVLTSIFQSDQLCPDGSLVDWGSATFSFGRLAPLLRHPEYIYDVMLGFIVSAGDSTESTAKYAADALLNFFQEIQNSRERLELGLDTVASVMERNCKVDRVSIAALTAVDLILTSGYLEEIVSEETSSPAALKRILDASVKEVSGSKNPKKMMAASRVWCDFLQLASEDLRSGALRQLCAFLLHPFPRVRKAIAQQLYEAILSNSATFLDNHTEGLMTILTTTDWDADETLLAPVVAELTATFNLD